MVPKRPFRHKLVLMVKEPVAGRVKTRLARGIGVAAATGFYRTATSAVCRRLGRDTRWQTILAVAPDTSLKHPAWPLHLPRRAQGQGDLGQRMQRLVDMAGDTPLGPGPVVIVGSDIPGITADLIAQAFQKLGSADMVIGPAPDGGYWLIGFKRLPRSPAVFSGIRWSHPQTLSDTLDNAAGLRIATVKSLDDIDEAEDYHAASAWCGRSVLPRISCDD
ncbi:MAG: TIGR04282 family arsenosugar biosynthesis glycosyltransferase [Alphaproteobacteria bacterium]|nr:TIGR04282 family arsenosugar biosynthesis glycosyltransferase [Alphaproteobacteria bacterium]